MTMQQYSRPAKHWSWTKVNGSWCAKIRVPAAECMEWEPAMRDVITVVKSDGTTSQQIVTASFGPTLDESGEWAFFRAMVYHRPPKWLREACGMAA